MQSAPEQHRRGTTLWDHLSILAKWRKLVLGYLIVVSTAAVIIALSVQVYYSSSSRLLPPPMGNMGLGSLLPNIASGAMGLAGMMSNESNLLMTVLESRSLADAVIDEHDWMTVHEYEFRHDAYTRFYDLFSWELKEDGTLGISMEEETAAEAQKTLSFIVDYIAREYNTISTAQARGQRVFIEKRLDQAYADLDSLEAEMKAFQRRTGVIEIESQLEASFQALANIQSELVLAEVQYDVFQSTLPSSSSEVLMAKRQVEALRSRLADLQSRNQDERNQMIIGLGYAPEVALPFLRMQMNIELQQTILEYLLPIFEQARITEQRDDANIYIVDPPNLPDKKSRPRRAFLVLGIVFLGFLLLYMVLVFIEWLRRLERDDPEQFEVVWGTLRVLSPHRFFARQSGDSVDSEDR